MRSRSDYAGKSLGTEKHGSVIRFTKLKKNFCKTENDLR